MAPFRSGQTSLCCSAAASGYHADALLRELGPGRELLLVDRHAACIEQCRSRFAAMVPNRIHVLSGDTGDPHRVIAEACRPGRTIQIMRHPASCRASPEFYDAIASALPRPEVQDRGSGGALLLFGAFFLEEELKNALGRTEGGVRLFRYTELKNSVQFEASFERAVREHRPAYILSVNMKGFDANGAVAAIARRCGVPLVIWFVDDPHPILVHQAAFVNDSMAALSWERRYLPWLKKKGFGSTAWLPLAGDPALFTPGDPSASHTAIGFAGSVMAGPFLDKIASQFLWNEQLRPLADETARLLSESRESDALAALTAACRTLGREIPFFDDKNLTWFIAYCIHSASAARRRELIGACVPLGVATFGDQAAWRNLLGRGAVCHGNIDYRTGLSAVYRGTAVNLNITSRQMPTAVNQRLFDIPLCNGFVLSDRQADGEELFAPDEAALYGSRDELLDKISYFSAHAEERGCIAHRARARILSCHTYDHRIAAIKKIIASL